MCLLACLQIVSAILIDCVLKRIGFVVFAGCLASSIDACDNPDCCYSATWQHTSRANALDDRWHCSNGTVILNQMDDDGKLLVDILLIDTNPLIHRYQSTEWAHAAGGIASQDAAQVGGLG